jgi:hypothetical protein
MGYLREVRSPLLPALLIVWALGCSTGNKTQQSSSPAPGPARVVTLDPGEASTISQAGGSLESTSDSSPLGNLDVAGVRLGMTPEQAIAALKQFDSGLFFSKRYLTDRDNLYLTEQTNELPATNGKTGEPEECAKTSSFRLFTGILAARSTAFIWGKTGGRGYVGCWLDATSQPVDEPMVVYLCLSPEAGNHRVIGVALRTKFGAPVTVESLLASTLKKYPSDLTARYAHNAENSNSISYQCRFWRFDGSGKALSETDARQNGLLGPERNYGELPSHVVEGAGVGIDLQVLAGADRNFAREFGLALYDENALYKFNGQAKAAYDEILEKSRLR